MAPPENAFGTALFGVTPPPTPAPFDAMIHECLYDSFTLWSLGVVGNVINVLGLIGNILTFFVLIRMQMTQKTSILLYIISITFSDSVILFFSSVTIYSLRAFGYMPSNLNYVNDMNRGYFLLFYLTEIFLYFNTWLTLAMCVDRYISVCKPHKASEFCNRSKALKVVIGLAIFISVFNIPKAFESTSIPDPTNMTQCLVTTETPLLDDDIYFWFYKMFLDVVLRFLFPLTTMVVLTIMTIVTLRSSTFGALEASKRKKTKKMTNTITWMCIAVVIVYVLCQVPLILVYALEPAITGSVPFQRIYTAAILLITLNSSVNFIIYCLLSPTFRRVFFTTLHCTCFQFMIPEDETAHSGVTRDTSMSRSRLSRQLSRTQSLEPQKAKQLNGFEPEEKIPLEIKTITTTTTTTGTTTTGTTTREEEEEGVDERDEGDDDKEEAERRHFLKNHETSV